MTVVLIVSLIFYFLFARPIQNILKVLAAPATSPINIPYEQNNQDEIGRLFDFGFSVNAAACEALELPEDVLLKQKLWDLANTGNKENYSRVLSEAKQKSVIKILREVTTPSGIDKTFEVSVRYIVLNDQGID